MNIIKIFVVNIISLVMHIPAIRFLCAKNFRFMCFYVSFLYQAKYHKKVQKVLLAILQSDNFRKNNKEKYWWFFMRLAVSIIQEQQVLYFNVNYDLEEKIIQLGVHGPKREKSYNIAYSFVGYSLWLFERADLQKAIEMVEIAAKLDDTWGYPEYLLGWYGLFLGGEHSLEHFKKAVERDWSFLHRMQQDRMCQRFPDIMKAVRKKTIV